MIMLSNIRLAIFGAHALDAEVMAGGLISKYSKASDEITILHMTRGERGHPEKSSSDFALQLDEEREKAARTLSVHQSWMGYPAGELPINEETVRDVKEKLLEIDPTHVITHWCGSWHPRHVNTHHIVRRALEELQDSKNEFALRGLYYGENCEDLAGFNPDLYVKLSSSEVDKWFEALRKYELFRLSEKTPMEVSIPYSDYYRSMAKVRGLESGVKYAQALMEEKRVGKLPLSKDTTTIL